MNVKIEKIEMAETQISSMNNEENQMRTIYMRDGVIDDTEQAALDRIKGKIDRLREIVARLRAEIEENKRIWESRSGDYENVRSQLEDLKIFEHGDAATLDSEISQIPDLVADQRWADATAALDQAEVSMGPVWDDYLQQSAAQTTYDPMRADFDTRLAAAKTAEPQTEAIAGRLASIEGNVGAIDTSVETRNYVEALERLTISIGELEIAEEEIRVVQEAKAEYDAALQALSSTLDAISVCEYGTLAEAQAEVAQLQTDMEAAAASDDYETAISLLRSLETRASEVNTQLVDIQSSQAQFETQYAPLQARITEVSVSEITSTSESQQTVADLQTEIEAAVAAEEFEAAIARLGDLDTALSSVEAILVDRDLYESRVAAMQDELIEATVSQEKWTYLGPIQSAMVTIQSAMEAAAQAEDYITALVNIGELEAKLAEFHAAIEAKKVEYDSARASFNRQVTAAQGNSTDALKTEMDNIKKAIKPIDTAAAAEDWVEASKLIETALDVIDTFNVAMFRATLPGMTTGLSEDALELAGRSPELTEELERLRDAGWQVQVGTAGGGSFASRGANPSITIDPNDLVNPSNAIMTLAHEAGHAEYENEVDTSSRENYMTSTLGDEGQATLNNIRIQREILANGGADIGIAGNSANHAAYNTAYDEFEESGDEEAARNAIGAIFGAGEVPSVNKPDGTPYADYNEYYGEWYDDNID